MIDTIGFSCCAAVPVIEEFNSNTTPRHRKRKSDTAMISSAISPTENIDWSNHVASEYVEHERGYNSPRSRHRKRRSRDFLVPLKKENLESNKNEIVCDVNPRWTSSHNVKSARTMLTSNSMFDWKAPPSSPSDANRGSCKGRDIDNPMTPVSKTLYSMTSPPLTPNTKEFIRKQSNSGPDVQKKQSPCGVEDIDYMYGWHRSLAWSESGDEQEEERFDDPDELLDHLSIPINIGEEFAPEDHPLNKGHSNMTSTIRAFRNSLSKTTLSDNIQIQQSNTQNPVTERILGPEEMETLELLSELTI